MIHSTIHHIPGLCAQQLEEIPQVSNSFHSEISSKHALLVGSLPTHLHVPTLAIGILIVTAELFWHSHGKRPDLQAIQKCLGLYCILGTADTVRNAVGEGLMVSLGLTHRKVLLRF